jgi:hypothetical protein
MLGSVPFTAGVLLGIRWLVYFMEGTSRTRIPSLILTAILILIGVQLWMFGFVADLMDVNRRMVEDLQLGMRRSELELSGPARGRFVSGGPDAVGRRALAEVAGGPLPAAAGVAAAATGADAARNVPPDVATRAAAGGRDA